MTTTEWRLIIEGEYAGEYLLAIHSDDVMIDVYMTDKTSPDELKVRGDLWPPKWVLEQTQPVNDVPDDVQKRVHRYIQDMCARLEATYKLHLKAADELQLSWR